MTTPPVDLRQALSSFDTLWSPRIVSRVNGFDVRIVKVRGEFVWHSHSDTDEFFQVLEGHLDIALREGEGRESTIHLPAGSVFTVPRGVEHKPSSQGGASILLFEATGTMNTGDREADLPDHVRPSAGLDVHAM